MRKGLRENTSWSMLKLTVALGDRAILPLAAVSQGTLVVVSDEFW
jgi:hypothetical protein